MLFKSVTVLTKCARIICPKALRHAGLPAWVGPIDNTSGRCGLPSFPRLLIAQVRSQCVGGRGSLLKMAVLQVKFQSSCAPPSSLRINGIKSSQHNKLTSHLHTATCN